MERTVRGSKPGRGKKDFSLLQNAETGSEAHLVSYQMGTGVIFRGNAAGAWCGPLTSI